MSLESLTTLALSSRHSIANLPFTCHRSPALLPVPQLLPVFTSLLKKRNPKRLKYFTQRLYKDDRMPMLYVEMDPLRVDTWKLEPVIKLIKDGAVGVIPTDTVYSIVCDLKSHSSIERLRRIKDIRSSKPLSILCHSLQDIDTYTTGFPRGNAQGQANIFRAVKHCLPGPYTFILPATKALPKQCIRHGTTTKFVSRKNVGVRIPDDTICQAILNNLDAPLISTSVESAEDRWIIDPIIIADTYGPEGLDFIVDGGTRIADPSTVVDMTRNPPTIIRQGKGPKQEWMVVEGEDSTA
ncbi:RNA binding/translational regulation protein of the SUA5 family protein [Dioscorea alata]|uniref:RNA binding/translational regulation protein of the SUA5 family protein n=1 Tax=Dioscorea alata TaxID=55571 RepID=A0ACB7UU12_DIOAL|nr:RNA binding/translational regulation protein of the SUA5 family protein [Dioscorea alata]